MDNSFLALARKYRPKKLEDLIGQEIFVSTIKNAIDSNRASHAYLLSGIRGVGKQQQLEFWHIFLMEKQKQKTIHWIFMKLIRQDTPVLMK